jgi:hypothetical protein
MKHRAGSSRKIRPSTLRDSRSAIEIQFSTSFELQCNSFILEVVETPEIQLLAIVFYSPGFGIEITVMVACDDNLLPVRKRSQPVKLLLYLFDCAIVCQVSRMNQHVAIGDREGVCMCVRDADNFDSGLVSRWFEWRATKAKEDGVDELDESS